MTKTKATRSVQVTALQMCSAIAVEDNFAWLANALENLPVARPQIVVLPEAFACFDGGDKRQFEMAEKDGDGPWQRRLAELAKRHQIVLVAGTLPLQVADDPQRFAASCLVFNELGERVARYDKIHLFDVDVDDNTGSYRESQWTRPGDQIVVVDLGFCKLGLAVCYDIRFPELFLALRDAGAEVVALPAAFTVVTGTAHWHTLVRARAIENQVIMVAGAQVGTHQRGRKTYGHGLIVDAWGQVLADAETAIGHISCALDLADIEPIRRKIPLQQQRRLR